MTIYYCDFSGCATFSCAPSDGIESAAPAPYRRLVLGCAAIRRTRADRISLREHLAQATEGSIRARELDPEASFGLLEPDAAFGTPYRDASDRLNPKAIGSIYNHEGPELLRR
jgi:hypothetical protein